MKTVNPAPATRGKGQPARAARIQSQDQLKRLIVELGGVDAAAVSDQGSLIEAGLDSVTIMRLATALRRHGADIKFSQLLRTPSLAAWWQLIAQSAEPARASKAAPKPSDEPSAPFALTPVQQAYWVGRRDDQPLGGVACHGYFELDGHGIDPPRLDRAVRDLAMRHSMLRARFLDDGRQQILPESPWQGLVTHDLRQVDAVTLSSSQQALRDALSHRVLRAEDAQVFDFQLSLLPGGATRIHFNIDLLVADVLSVGLILSDLSTIYAGAGASLPVLSTTFAQYLAANAVDAAAFEEARAYWAQRIAQMPAGPALPLATDPRKLTHPRFTRREFHLGRDEVAALRRRAKAAQVTPSVALLSAFAEVLARWSSDSRFLVNVPLFDRQETSQDIAHLVADFTNMLLLEADLTQDKPFAERARDVQAQLHQDLGHAAYSGVQVLRDLARHARDQDAPAFRGAPVVFACNLDRPFVDRHCRDTLGDVGWMISQTPQIWIDHQVSVLDDGRLALNWDCVESLFKPGCLDAMFGAYEALVRQLCDSAWTRPAPLGLPAAQQQTRERVNATQRDIDPRLLHELFVETARRTPDAVALYSGGRALSYAQLAGRALAQTARLREHGIASGDRVVVMLPKCEEQIAAVLGVLLSGAAYVPLSMAIPRARVAQICTDAQVKAVITCRSDLPPDTFAGSGSLRLDTSDAIADAVALTTWTRPPGAANTDLAYLIYTSGSTGVPKGVSIDHRGAVNTVADINRRLSLGAQDRVFGLSNLSFDLSVYDLFGPLAVGAALVLPHDDDSREPARWLAQMQAHGVSVWNSVPALFDMLLEHVEGLREPLPHSLRAALISGDWIALGLPGRARALRAGLRFVALGGATEASIWSNAFEVQDVDADWPSIPYGFPLANQRYRIRDARGRDCPDWVAGHLYIGGIGLAQGYWNDAARTAASFITADDGERLYRTGDLARYWPDGAIEFLGRTDHQVKVGGNRIELGEIEAVLARHPDIRRAVVDASGSDGRSRRLSAYIVPASDGPHRLLRTQHIDAQTSDRRWHVVENRAHATAALRLAELDRARFAEFWQMIERLSALAMRHTLERAGLFGQAGATHDTGEILHALQAQPRYHKLVGQWLDSLVDSGSLQKTGAGRYRSSGIVEPLSFEAFWAYIDATRILGEGRQEIRAYLQRSIANLGEMLRGDVDPLEVYLPGGSTRTVDAIFRHNPATALLNKVMASVAQAIAEQWPAEAPLEVLEAGAGTGSATRGIVESLGDRPARYDFTDLSEFFLNTARDDFSAQSFMSFGIFDLNIDPALQGYEEASRDVIVASGVLHDVRNLPAALARLRTLLRPGGVLLMLESVRNCRLQMITIGFIEGMNQYDDWRVLQNLPFPSFDDWSRELSAAGFDRVVFAPGLEESDVTFGGSVIVARASESQVQLDEAAIRDHLAAELPEYMIPASFHLLHELPLSANGKVDRSRLPKPKAAPAPRQRREKLRPGMETDIAAIWGRLLSLQEVSANDHFFDIGGDSLLAVRMVGAVRAYLDSPVPVRHIFEQPQLRAFVAAIGRAQGWSPMIRMATGPRGCVVCVHGADGGIGGYRALAAQLAGEYSVYGLQARGLEPGQQPARDLHALVDTYAREIDRTCPDQPLVLLGWSLGAQLANAVAARLLATGRDVQQLVLVDPLSQHCFVRNGGVPLGRMLGLDTDATDDAQTLYQQARTAGSALADAPFDHFERVLSVLSANAALAQDHTPPRVEVPTLVVQAAQHPPHWADAARDWAPCIAAAQVSLTVDADHWAVIAAAPTIAALRAALAAQPLPAHAASRVAA